MPTEIAQIRAANGEEIPILIESKLRLDGKIAALIIAQRGAEKRWPNLRIVIP